MILVVCWELKMFQNVATVIILCADQQESSHGGATAALARESTISVAQADPSHGVATAACKGGP